MKQTKSHIHRHTRRRILSALTACGLFLSLSITGCSNAPEENDSSTKNTTASAETSSDGSIFRFGDFSCNIAQTQTVDQTLFAQADVTMINVWTTFCTYCLDEMPALQSLSEEYKDEGFQVVGIVSDVAKSDDETVQNIIDATGTEYMHIIPSSDLTYRISAKCVRSDYIFCRFQRKTDRRPVSWCKRSGCMGEDHRRNARTEAGEYKQTGENT